MFDGYRIYISALIFEGYVWICMDMYGYVWIFMMDILSNTTSRICSPGGPYISIHIHTYPRYPEISIHIRMFQVPRWRHQNGPCSVTMLLEAERIGCSIGAAPSPMASPAPMVIDSRFPVRPVDNRTG